MEIITSAKLNNIITFTESIGVVPEVVIYKMFAGYDFLDNRINILVKTGWLKKTTLANETAYFADGGVTSLSPAVRQRAFAWFYYRVKEENCNITNNNVVFPKMALCFAVAPDEPNKYPGLILLPYGYPAPPRLPGTYLVEEKLLWKQKLSVSIQKHWKEEVSV